ncbi:MAG: hypothetical protein ACK57C_07140, partial [Bacteroidota bacterium]
MQNIRHIIFDLGGIFLNLNYQLTAQAFRRLGVTNFDELFTQHHANPLFEQLETGRVSNEHFFQSIRDLTQLPLSDEQITEAWNAMLLDEEGNELILPKSEQIPQDFFKKGETIRSVVASVDLK